MSASGSSGILLHMLYIFLNNQVIVGEALGFSPCELRISSQSLPVHNRRSFNGLSLLDQNPLGEALKL